MTDTYPTRKGTSFNWYKILTWIFIIICAWLLWKTCNPKKQPALPQVQPSAEKVKEVNTLDKGKKNSDDSFSLVIKHKDALISQYKKDLQAESLKADMAERGVDALLQERVPDTCLELQRALTGKFQILKDANQKKDAANANAISVLQSVNKTQKSFLASKDTAYKKLHVLFDTCISDYSKLEKYAKKLKPKGEVFIGAQASSLYNIIQPTLGLSLGYKTKGSLYIEVGGNLRKEVFISVKHRLFKL